MTNDIDGAFVPTSFRILNDPHKFGRWKNPLIDAVARANGCKVQVVRPEFKNADNAILFGRAKNAAKTIRMFHKIQKSAFIAVCDRMRLDGVHTSDKPYSVSFYAGYVEGIAEQLSESIAAHMLETSEVARQFPQSNEAYPVHTKIDDRIASFGREAGRTAKVGWAHEIALATPS